MAESGASGALELRVARALVAAGLEVLSLDASGASVRRPGEEEVCALSFSNLDRALDGLAPAEEARVLERYVALWTARRPMDAFEGGRLLPRLLPPGTLSEGLAAPWVAPKAGGHLLEALVRDLPDAVRWVTPLDLPRWRLSVADARRDALANLEASSAAARAQVASADGPFALESGDGYDAARLLLLPRWMPAARGAFVVVPSRDLLVAIPVRRPADLPAASHRAAALQAQADALTRRMPYPLSPQLFWCSEGILEVIPVRRQGEAPLLLFPENVARAAAGEDA